jgi:hypothetical protein
VSFDYSTGPCIIFLIPSSERSHVDTRTGRINNFVGANIGHILTRRELSDSERYIAAFGVATLGGIEIIAAGARLAKDADRLRANFSAIEGLSPAQIAEKFSLDKIPNKIIDIIIPAGTRLRKGTPAKVMLGKESREAPRQWEIVDKAKPEWFKNFRLLK